MTFGYLLIAAILFSCILADRFSGKFGMPALILFMAGFLDVTDYSKFNLITMGWQKRFVPLP